MEVARLWDAALRAADWATARQLLTDDAEYHTPEASAPDYNIDCTQPDQIVALMRSFKGQMPDIVVVTWAAFGNHVVARLRQREWGTDSDWWQVLAIRDDKVARLTDCATEQSAFDAIGGR